MTYFQLIPNLLSQATPNDAFQRVIDPQIAGINVTLYYNCFYMNNICANANSFAALPRGAILHPGSSLPNNVYGFDFNEARKDRRRDKMCPSNWKNRPANRCPATGSLNPFRSAHIWFTSALEPGTTVNQIANRRDPATNQVTINSKIRYTCDEFPPASWVEGGNGAALLSPGTTRCAAARCAAGINAEQDCTYTSIIYIIYAILIPTPSLPFLFFFFAFFFQF